MPDAGRPTASGATLPRKQVLKTKRPGAREHVPKTGLATDSIYDNAIHDGRRAAHPADIPFRDSSQLSRGQDPGDPASMNDTASPNASGQRGKLNLTPGMSVTAEIKTGKRSVAHYFLDPVIETGQESLRER